ncbi:metalloregulator ArsR/SmtB family transcription factor [Saccharothrix sp. SC076]|nr:metalloregulator ArsR/SmtB family transcription factor [Saccharothrix obliqua]
MVDDRTACDSGECGPGGCGPEGCGTAGAGSLDTGAAADLAAKLKLLADPVRLRLLNLLATAPAGEVCACDLVEPLGRSQPTISHHLKVLRDAGLVDGERRGTWIWYSVRREAIVEVLDALRAATGLAASLV